MQIFAEQKKTIFELEAKGVFALTCLSRDIRSKLSELDALSQGQRHMESELEAFLTEYYKRILPLAETLSKLRHAIEAPHTEFLSPKKGNASVFSNPVEQHAKMLYRKLVKAYHPDASANGEAHGALQGIIAAYTEKNISKLWQLDIERECYFIDDTIALMHYLNVQLDKISNMLKAIHLRKEALVASSAWRLKERVFDANLRGIDLIHLIACRLEQEIAAAHKNQQDKMEKEVA